MDRPSTTEYAEFYQRYVARVTETDILGALESQTAELTRVLAGVTREREHFRYAEGKWSVREVLGHLIDAERVFGFRAFSFSRGEAAPLPSFEENDYVARSRYAEQTLADLLDEFVALRRSNLACLRPLKDTDWTRVGIASGKPVSVRALAYIMVGHVRHHMNVLAERYGIHA